MCEFVLPRPAPVGALCSKHSTLLLFPTVLLRCLCSVKSYETKLAALNALNSALQKENEDLRDDLEEALAREGKPKAESGGLRLTE
jgi:hypothetical protein